MDRRLIRTESGGYRVPADAVATDVAWFDDLVREAAATFGERRLTCLRAAVEVGSGDLLADEPYAESVLLFRPGRSRGTRSG